MLVLLLLSVTVTGCFNQDTIPVYNNVDGQVLENGEPVFGARIHFRNNYDPGGFTQQAIGDSVSISFRTNIQDVYEAGLFRYSADSSFVIFFKDTLEAGQHNIQIPDSLMSNGVYGYEVFSETRYLGASLFLVNKPDSALIGTYPLTTTNFEGNFSLDAQKMALGQRFNFSDGNRFQITDSIQIIVEKDRQIRAIKSVKVKPDAENFFEITLD
ncbi:hypothetical protein [Gracilimonas tropica]|uniref:hypothetical protein n=1 Tax=Gracilimonas tropica TaxID=454600 RepID=UPI0003819CCD|nr:hypothetical protein [Gracilimonas tropica]